ncbi:MAG TPA: MBL fold metallo-hydrolase [Kineosporiaceae bacterium]|nr:MBL fold metallo-hydrolase [Kineosporiaceae bacterium]
MKLTVVGCSGSFAGPDSPASCYLVEADDADGRTWRVVLDLGSGALGPLQRHARLDALDAVVLSHLHPDHMSDVCGLYVARRYAPGGPAEPRLPVYGPAGTAERLRQAYGGEGSGLADTFDVRELADAVPVELGPLTLTPYRVEHPVEAYGVRVEAAAGRRTEVLAYTGDTDACAGLLPLARGADVLLAEASFQEGRDEARGVHLTGLRAGQAAADAGCRRLLLTHVPVWTDPEVVLAEARSAFPGSVELARPGGVYLL